MGDKKSLTVGHDGKMEKIRETGNHGHCWMAREWPEGGVNSEG